MIFILDILDLDFWGKTKKNKTEKPICKDTITLTVVLLNVKKKKKEIKKDDGRYWVFSAQSGNTFVKVLHDISTESMTAYQACL